MSSLHRTQELYHKRNEEIRIERELNSKHGFCFKSEFYTHFAIWRIYIFDEWMHKHSLAVSLLQRQIFYARQSWWKYAFRVTSFTTNKKAKRQYKIHSTIWNERQTICISRTLVEYILSLNIRKVFLVFVQ